MFTQEQLDAIKYSARKTKNQGEIAVYLHFMKEPRTSDFNLSGQQANIIKFCVEECKRQHSGEMSVYDMVNAWNYAVLYDNTEPDGYLHPHIDKDFIEEIGRLVEPYESKNGFRKFPVFVGLFEKENPEFIEKDLMTLLYLYYEGVLQDYPNLNFLQGGNTNLALHDMMHIHETLYNEKLPAEDMFYYYYEMIHPFIDGNGRSGKILYNYLCGTLDAPMLPPNFWGGIP